MSAGLIPDGTTFSNIKSLKVGTKGEKVQNNLQQKEEKKFFDQRSQGEIEIARQIKQKNQIIKQQKQQKQQTKQRDKPNVKTLSSHPSNFASSKGFANVLMLSLIVIFVAGVLFMVVHMIVGW